MTDACMAFDLQAAERRSARRAAPWARGAAFVLLLAGVAIGPLALDPAASQPFTHAKGDLLQVCMALVVLAALLGNALAGRVHGWERNPVGVPLGLFVVALLASSVDAANRIESAAAIQWHALGAVFLLAVCAMRLRPGSVQVVLGAVAAPSALVAATAILEYLGFLEWNGVPLVPYALRGRIIAYFGHHNHVAHYLLAAFLLSVGGALAARGRVRRIAWGGLALLDATGLYVTFSRGAWVGAVCGTGFLVLALARRAPRARLRSGAAVVLACVLAAACAVGAVEACAPSFAPGTSFQATQEKRAILLEAGDSSRFRIWADTLAMAADHPVNGVGAGNWWVAFPAYDRNKTEFQRYAHNDFLQILAETGPAGLVAFLVLAAMFGVRSLRGAVAAVDRRGRIQHAALGAAVAGTLANSFFSYNLSLPVPMFLVWLCMGLGTGLRAGARPSGPRPGRDAPRLLGVLGVVVGLLAVGVSAHAAVCSTLGDRAFAASRRARAGGDAAGAVAHLRRAVLFCPHRAPYLHALGALLLPRDPAGAVAPLDRAAELTPCAGANRIAAAAAAGAAGDLSSASVHMEAFLEVSPDDAAARNALGNLYARQGRHVEAEGEFRRALAADAALAGARYNLARALEAQGRFPEAREAYGVVAAALPGNRAARHGMARSAAAAGAPREAAALYAALLGEDPSDAAACKNLGILYVERLECPEAGRAYLCESLRLDPGQREAAAMAAYLEGGVR